MGFGTNYQPNDAAVEAPAAAPSWSNALGDLLLYLPADADGATWANIYQLAKVLGDWLWWTKSRFAKALQGLITIKGMVLGGTVDAASTAPPSGSIQFASSATPGVEFSSAGLLATSITPSAPTILKDLVPICAGVVSNLAAGIRLMTGYNVKAVSRTGTGTYAVQMNTGVSAGSVNSLFSVASKFATSGAGGTAGTACPIVFADDTMHFTTFNAAGTATDLVTGECFSFVVYGTP